MLTAVHSLNGYQQFYHRVMTRLHLQGCPIASIALVHLCLSSVSTSIEISVCCNLYTCMHWLTLIDGYKRQWPRGREGGTARDGEAAKEGGATYRSIQNFSTDFMAFHLLVSLLMRFMRMVAKDRSCYRGLFGCCGCSCLRGCCSCSCSF